MAGPRATLEILGQSSPTFRASGARPFNSSPKSLYSMLAEACNGRGYRLVGMRDPCSRSREALLAKTVAAGGRARRTIADFPFPRSAQPDQRHSLHPSEPCSGKQLHTVVGRRSLLSLHPSSLLTSVGIADRKRRRDARRKRCYFGGLCTTEAIKEKELDNIN